LINKLNYGEIAAIYDPKDPDKFINDIKNGKIFIRLPPIKPIDVNNNMKNHFVMEAALAKSL
jgi:hypothetical protein